MTSTCPLPAAAIIDQYFMEHRAKLIDIAAFLDRVDRAADDSQRNDFRMTAFRDAVRLLIDGRSERARRILEQFSDPTVDPIAKAPMKGALGACRK